MCSPIRRLLPETCATSAPKEGRLSRSAPGLLAAWGSSAARSAAARCWYSAGRAWSHARRAAPPSGRASSSSRLITAISAAESFIPVAASMAPPGCLPPSFQRGGQDQTRLLPVSLHRAFRDAQGLSHLPLAVAAEVAHLHHLRQAWLGLGQLLECLMHLHDAFLPISHRSSQLCGQRQRPG